MSISPCPEPGRGVRLNRRKRAEVWRAIEAIETSLDAQGKKTFLQVADHAADQLKGAAVRPFDHVLVDESQDLHPAQWRLLRAVVAEGPDDLFIAGDTHQRIYNNRVSLKQLGIDIRGRSSRLKLNYRTTRQILNLSLRLIVGDRFDDLDEGEETLFGYRSATEGSEPEIDTYADFGAELEGLVKTVRGWREAGVEPAEIGVCARTNTTAEQARGALASAGLPASKSGSGTDEIHVGSMHGMKGLEFRCVAMIDLSAGSVPPASAITPAEDDPLGHAQDLQRERCLLYVAATRARETLYMSHTGDLTPLMDKFESSSAAKGRNLIVKHLTQRVAWHDRKWDGHVCDHPKDNSSCLALDRSGRVETTRWRNVSPAFVRPSLDARQTCRPARRRAAPS